MNTLVSINKQHQSITTSRIVAETFEKNHFHVLRDIRELQCSDEFRATNFGLMVEMKELPQGGAARSEYYGITNKIINHEQSN